MRNATASTAANFHRRTAGLRLMVNSPSIEVKKLLQSSAYAQNLPRRVPWSKRAVQFVSFLISPYLHISSYPPSLSRGKPHCYSPTCPDLSRITLRELAEGFILPFLKG